MHGVLVDRDQEKIGPNDLVFVVYPHRHLTEEDVGFDVIHKNIPEVCRVRDAF